MDRHIDTCLPPPTQAASTPAKVDSSNKSDGKGIKGFFTPKAAGTNETTKSSKKKRKVGSAKSQSTISFSGRKSKRSPLEEVNGNRSSPSAKAELGKRKRDQPNEDEELERVMAISAQQAREDAAARRARMEKYQGAAEEEVPEDCHVSQGEGDRAMLDERLPTPVEARNTEERGKITKEQMEKIRSQVMAEVNQKIENFLQERQQFEAETEQFALEMEKEMQQLEAEKEKFALEMEKEKERLALETEKKRLETTDQLRRDREFATAILNGYRQLEEADRQVEAERQQAAAKAEQAALIDTFVTKFREAQAEEKRIEAERQKPAASPFQRSFNDPPDEMYAMTESILDSNVPAASFYCVKMLEDYKMPPSKVAAALIPLAPRCVVSEDTSTGESFTTLVANTLALANAAPSSTSLLVTQTVVLMARSDKSKFFSRGYAEIKEALAEEGIREAPVPDMLVEYSEESIERRRFLDIGEDNELTIEGSSRDFNLQALHSSYLPGHLGTRSFMMEEPEIQVEL